MGRCGLRSGNRLPVRHAQSVDQDRAQPAARHNCFPLRLGRTPSSGTASSIASAGALQGGEVRARIVHNERERGKSLSSYWIGVDLGGTNVRAAAIDENGEMLGGQARRPSLAEGEAAATFDQIVSACREVVETCGGRPEGAGIGLPGIMESGAGICRWSPNFPLWKDEPIGPYVAERLRCPVTILNDGKCAGLGELRSGAGRGVRNMVMITLGTGIGGCFVVDGRLLIGPSGSVAEVGHHTVSPGGRRCGCGNFGCWEAMCARDAIVEAAERKLQQGRASILAAAAPEALTPQRIAEAAATGDLTACEVMDEIGFWIGVGCANLINMLNPQRLVVGGGIAAAGELLLAPIRRTVARRAVALQRDLAEIVTAQLGDNAGIYGAAAVAREGLPQ